MRRTCLDVPSKVVRRGPPNEFLVPADAMDDTIDSDVSPLVTAVSALFAAVAHFSEAHTRPTHNGAWV
jgi:hypothetical protein